MKQRKKPSLRFKGFDNDWEQRKLGELATFNKGAGYSKSDLKASGTQIILYGRLYTKYETVIKQVDTFVNSRPGSVYSEGGEVIVPASGETAEDIAIASVVEKPGILLGGDLNIIHPIRNLDSTFLAISISNGEPHKEMAKKAQGKSVVHLHNDDLSQIKFRYPSIEEQSKISKFFSNLDNLITLHQRKLEKLQNLKKAMLEKMFPKNGAKVPEIRFKGFTNDWEQRKFGNLFSFLQNNTLSRSALDNENGRIQTVHYGDVLIKFGECLDVTKEILPFIRDDSIAEKYKDSFLQNGDIIIADTAEDETVGKCTEIVNLSNQKIIAGLHTMPVRSNENFAAGYLGFYLNSDSFHNQLKPLMQGTKVTSISKRAIQDTVVKYPLALEEQQEIGKYFLNLDNLITLHQCKLEKLQNLKKAMLEKMFI